MPWRIPTHGTRPRTHYPRQDQGPGTFYKKRAWKDEHRGVRVLKLQRTPYCEIHHSMGALVPATHVHHIIPISACIDRALDMDNMQSLCASCHSRLHAHERHDSMQHETGRRVNLGDVPIVG